MDVQQIKELYQRGLWELVSEANRIHRENFNCAEVQLSSLLSIKTGGCSENCSYCPQSAHYKTGLTREALLGVKEVIAKAQLAKQNGATRFCMGAAWREVREGAEFERVLEMVREVRALDLEVCCTLGMLNRSQAERLKVAGLYAYNHNIDTSRKYYEKIISTRTYDDRLRTIQNVRDAGLTVCTGGIVGMGETDQDRIEFLHQLTVFSPPPESVSINALIPIAGTPLESQGSATTFEILRVIACARILLPKTMVRLSAGRKALSEEAQFLCFLAGANSIFLGDRLLTSSNPSVEQDTQLFEKIGVRTNVDVSLTSQSKDHSPEREAIL